MLEWHCPTCSAPNRPPGGGEPYRCAYCRTTVGMAAVVCPNCGRVSVQGADSCTDCGEPLSTVGRVLYRHEQAGRPPRWLEQARNQAAQLKAAEAAQSDARMQAFLEIEQRRQSALHQARVERQARDRRVVIGSLVAAVAVLLTLALLLLLTAPRP